MHFSHSKDGIINMDYDNLDQTETNHDETAWLVFSAVADRQFTQM